MGEAEAISEANSLIARLDKNHSGCIEYSGITF